MKRTGAAVSASAVRLERRAGARRPLSLALTVGLHLAAGTSMAYLAGFDAVYERLAHARWLWLLPPLAAVLAGLAGYFVAYRVCVAERGTGLDARSCVAMVAAGLAAWQRRSGWLSVPRAGSVGLGNPRS